MNKGHVTKVSICASEEDINVIHDTIVEYNNTSLPHDEVVKVYNKMPTLLKAGIEEYGAAINSVAILAYLNANGI